MPNNKTINPHFDHGKVIWKDDYSGLYEPVDYSEQFDPEWKLFLENKTGFKKHTGVETDDAWINDRIFDLTGVENYLGLASEAENRDIGGRQNLDLRFSPDYFRGKQCLDVACGAGRWTKTLLALGAKVKSIDVSEHGLESVRRFNDDVECLDIFDIPQRQDLHEAFDFTLGWGILMHTHDPKVAFENVAKTVKPGGGLYVMVYAPTYHNSPEILAHRRHYHNLRTFDEKLAYAYSIADTPENTINYLDMLNTFYNWVVPEETIHHWYHANGFLDVITLNASEKPPGSYHVFGRKRNYDLPLRDDSGNLVPRISKYDASQIILLKKPFVKEKGFAWRVSLHEYTSIADDMDHPDRSKLILLEDGKPLWFRHIIHDEIQKVGKGLYSHWGAGLVFSTADNSDPNINGRTYQIVFAESADGMHIPRIPKYDASQIIPLKKPFVKEKGFAWQVSLREYASTADDIDNLYRSKLILLEDGKPLWSRHIPHDDIRKVGKGCYSHWGEGLKFSTTDNSDPNTNGRTYQIVFAESAD